MFHTIFKIGQINGELTDNFDFCVGGPIYTREIRWDYFPGLPKLIKRGYKLYYIMITPLPGASKPLLNCFRIILCSSIKCKSKMFHPSLLLSMSSCITNMVVNSISNVLRPDFLLFIFIKYVFCLCGGVFKRNH